MMWAAYDELRQRDPETSNLKPTTATIGTVLGADRPRKDRETAQSRIEKLKKGKHLLMIR
jgi:hypothetical protein